MLSKTVLKTITLIVLFNFIFFDSYLPFQNIKNLYAADFDTALQEGKSLGSNLVDDFNPQNLDQTLQDKDLGTLDSVTPQIDEAQQQKNSYENFYSNPQGMTSSTNTDTDVGNFVTDSYQGRTKFDLSSEPVFGNKCLQTDADGKCTIWSSSADIITSTYTDCEKVVIPEYEDPSTEATCTGTNTIQATSCETKTFVDIKSETVNIPCSETSPEYKPGQIYAVCRDYYDYFKVYSYTAEDRDDCRCENHDGALCDTPPNYSEVNTPPSGSRYIGTSYENFRDRDKRSGWDDCTSDRYKWYTKYRHSVVERVFLQYDSPCGSNIEKWAEECTVDKLEQCDPSGNNCIVSIEDSQDTGQMPDFTYLTKVSQGTTTVNDCDPCEPIIEYDSDWQPVITGWDCPASECISGSCPSDAVLKPSPSDSAVKIGEERKTLSYSCEEEYIYDDWGNIIDTQPITRTYEDFFYYKDPRVCNNYSGSIENYLICLKYYTVEIDNGKGLRQLTSTSVKENTTTDEYYNSVSWFRVYGGPDVKPYLNNWYARITFSCEQGSSNCQDLIDQGCVEYSHRCLDSDCTQIEYTYKCGGTGEIKGYKIAYNCSGKIRCMGTECVDASYEANKDFAAAATAMEVFNHYRVDATETEIFPGESSECQSSPKDCCKNPGGMSTGDYVNAARATISAYSMLSGGLAATWASYAEAFTYVTTLGELGSIPGLSSIGVTGNTISTTLSTELIGETGIQAAEQAGLQTFTSGGQTVVANTSSTVSALSTIATTVTVALIVYSIARFVYDFVFRCTDTDILTSYKNGMRLCREIGSKCADEVLGVCIKKEKVYCCFNSLLARVLHEQGRGQLGRTWGDVYSPDCAGFSPGELGSLDFSQIDLREYMQYVAHQTEISPEKIEEIIDKATSQIKQSFQD